ncbi:Fc.00g109710.m01.CDS01 [Cosmosporella sp. VM-42]
MVKRSLASAFRPFHNLRASSVQARHFTSTPSYGVSAVFSETDNAELNRVLNTIQEKIIFPAYLPPKQRELVFDPKMRNHLQQNPVVIELDGLEHKFSTIDRFKDIPNSKKILNQALDLMKTKEEWDNLATLLAGYHKAAVKLQRFHYARVIRMAGTRGSPYTIIECAKQAHKTGLTLKEKEYVVQLLVCINAKITNCTPEEKKSEAAQALKWTELVVDLLQRPEHSVEGAQPADRLHFSPFVRGLLVFTQASAAQATQQAGEPIEAELAALAENVELLTSIWARHDIGDISKVQDVQDLNPLSQQSRSKVYDAALSGSSYVQVLAQNIKGLALARELVGDAAQGLKPVEEAIQKHLTDFVLAGHKYRYGKGWPEVYEQVMGEKPNWPAAPEKKVADSA